MQTSKYISYIFAKNYLQQPRSEIEIFDLGAGTGAVQWAVGLFTAMKEAKQKTPNVKYQY